MTAFSDTQVSGAGRSSSEPVSVLFVCLGNICRSPTAHAVFQQKVNAEGLGQKVRVDSAGTAAFHIGSPPDRRSIKAAQGRGYDLSVLRARQANEQDFHDFDYILTMDQSNYENMQAIRPANAKAQLSLFLDFDRAGVHAEVPDPYYGGNRGFEDVLDMVEAAADGLLKHIAAQDLQLEYPSPTQPASQQNRN